MVRARKVKKYQLGGNLEVHVPEADEVDRILGFKTGHPIFVKKERR